MNNKLAKARLAFLSLCFMMMSLFLPALPIFASDSKIYPAPFSRLMTGLALAESGMDHNAERCTATGTIRVLPEEVSQSLRIQRIPTSRPIPLIVGNYWNCHQDHGFEICRITWVVCTDDQSLCVEGP